MKISSVSTDFVNNDIQYNINKIIKYTIDSSKNGSDMVCFGEMFLQGFDSLSWNYEIDKEIAVTSRNPIVKKIIEQAIISKIAIGFGFLEKNHGKIFSSYLIIDKNGSLTKNDVAIAISKFKANIDIIGINPFVFIPENILKDLFKQAGKEKGPISVKGTVNNNSYKQT